MIHASYRAVMRKAAAWLALLTLGLVLTLALSGSDSLPPGARDIAGYVPLHTLVETLAVVIAGLVFAVSWHAYSRELPGNTLILGCAFLGVGLLDFSHMLSFQGMPDYVTPSNPEKAINFWLAARALAALALLAAALAPWRSFTHGATRYLHLAAMLGVTAVIHWLLLLHPDALPRTFVPGQGLTPFKIGAEYGLVALNLGAALALWRRMRTQQIFDAPALFVAVCTMALSELFFTLYASLTDAYNLMGHLYKVLAYLFLYRAIFVETVQRPRRQLLAAQSQLRSTFEAIPDLLFIKDADGTYIDCNPAFERLYGTTRANIVGKIPEDFVSAEQAAAFREHDRKAIAAGKPSSNEEWLTSASDGHRALFETIKTPMRDAQGGLIGLAAISRDITAARSTQEALRLSEQRLQQAVCLAFVGIFDHDHVRGTLHWSAEHREFYGVGAAETMTLAGALARLFPADRDRVRAAIARGHDPAGDGQFHGEYRIIRPNGEMRVLETRSLTLFGGEGRARRPLRTIGAALDVTETKRAEAVLRDSEQSLALTLQSIGDGVIATDLNGRVTRMNTVAERLTGWPLAAALGQALTDVFDIIDTASRQPLPCPARRVLVGGAIERLPANTVLRARDKREHHVSDSAAPIRDVSGMVTGVVLVFSDVSEHYRAQQALAAHFEALKIRDHALTHVSQGVMVTDAKLLITYVNPCFERFTGYSSAETLGRNPSFLQGAAISSVTLAEISRALRTGNAFKGEILHARRDGVSHWMALDYAPMRDTSGVLTGFVGTLRDVAEQKQAEAARRSLEAQLRESQRMEAIGTLAGGIAHDFNNILGAIMGNVALARGDLPAGHPALKSLDQIGKGGALARNLVQQILAFSRRQPHELVSQPLRPLVEESLALLRATLPARVTLQAVLTEVPLYLNADGSQIQQVVMNLCTNAWHALQDSAGSITVGLEEVVLDATAALAAGALSPGRYAHLWVRDTGTGIDAATRTRIFEPFFSTKPVGAGTGLGLAVVHGIVAAHQGVISVDSAVAMGSTFHLYFPALEQRVGVSAAAPAMTPPVALQGEGQHVLYVDDDEVMLLVVERLLQRAGYRVTCCQNADDALALVRAAPEAVDVVVTDYNMPARSGLELAEALAQVRADLPVVISSGYLSEELRIGADRLGLRHLLQKQDTAEELASLLRRVLAQ